MPTLWHGNCEPLKVISSKWLYCQVIPLYIHETTIRHVTLEQGSVVYHWSVIGWPSTSAVQWLSAVQNIHKQPVNNLRRTVSNGYQMNIGAKDLGPFSGYENPSTGYPDIIIIIIILAVHATDIYIYSWYISADMYLHGHATMECILRMYLQDIFCFYFFTQ